MSYSATQVETTQPGPRHGFKGAEVDEQTRTHEKGCARPAGADAAASLRQLASANRRASMDSTGEGDAVSAYMARLRRVEPLEAEQQHRLACRYVEDGDLDAAKLLILTNLRLVVQLAKEYRRRSVDLLDLIQEGNVGLAEAVTRFDPYRGVKFTSYAQYWVRAMILNYLMNCVHPVRIGGSRAGRKLFYNLKKARRELTRQGIQPSAEQVAQYLEVDESEVIRVGMQLDAPPVALDAPAKGFEATTVGQLIPGDYIEPEEAVAQRELSAQIDQLIHDFGESLSRPRTRAIWHERMIVDNAKTLKDLGRDWDVSKERIRQVEAEIRDEFKYYLLDNLGEDVELSWLSV